MHSNGDESASKLRLIIKSLDDFLCFLAFIKRNESRALQEKYFCFHNLALVTNRHDKKPH